MKISKLIICLYLLTTVRVSAQMHRSPELDNPQHLPPEAQFSWLGGCYGDTTHFINSSIRATFYQWYIFDKLGDTLYSSTTTDISYYFSTTDTFYVFLQCDNGHIVSTQDTLIIGGGIKADFDYFHCKDQLLNHCFCATSYQWDFGDGATSTDSLPVHQYADTGSYIITLIVSNGVTSDTMVKSVYVSVVGYADGAFTLNVSNDTLFYQINNYIPYTSIYWNWGDGNTGDSIQGYYVYPASGTYYLNLNQVNGCGIIMHDTTIQITVPAGIANISSTGALKVYPNPSSSGIFTLEATDKINSVVVCDIMGNILIDGKHCDQKSKTIDLSDYPRGQYILRVVSDKDASMARILKQ